MTVGLSPSRAATWLEEGGGRQTGGREDHREDHRPRVGKGRVSSSTAVVEENSSITGFQPNWTGLALVTCGVCSQTGRMIHSEIK